jgi:hypothetical protein
MSAPTLNHSHTNSRISSRSLGYDAADVRLFDQRAYADCRRELVIAIVTLIGRIRAIYPTPESIAACADVEATLCRGESFRLTNDERQLSLWRDAA